jgi:3-dehydroquinate synthase
VTPLDLNEASKNLENIIDILHELEAFGIARRSEPIIAIGGGSLLDYVGFACSIYRRVVPYVRVPTTLLSIVAVSVAIKTGINHFDT